MRSHYSVGPVNDEQELTAVIDALASAFNVDRERDDQFIDLVGRENFRAVRSTSCVAGGLALVPMGQFFCGEPVTSIGISAVAISPEFRGSGAAAALMTQVMRELHEQHQPLSSLYPATQPLYRRAGFEQAGSRFEITLPLATIEMNDRTLTMRRMTDDDLPAIEDVYRREAARHAGMLDRGDFIWQRTRVHRFEKPVDGFVVERDGDIEGYIYYLLDEGTYGHYGLCVNDIVALTPDAGRRLLTFLADHRSLGDRALLFRGLADPLLGLLRDRRFDAKLLDHWMLRIVDVERALADRRYPLGVEAELHLDVRDDLLDANNDRFILRIGDGRGSIERGGEGRLAVDIRALASLYTGFRSPRQLVATGGLCADEREADRATAVFAGPSPWMADMF